MIDRDEWARRIAYHGKYRQELARNARQCRFSDCDVGELRQIESTIASALGPTFSASWHHRLEAAPELHALATAIAECTSEPDQWSTPYRVLRDGWTRIDRAKASDNLDVVALADLFETAAMVALDQRSTKAGGGLMRR